MAKTKSKFEGFRKYTVEGYEYFVTYFQAELKGNKATTLIVADQFTAFLEKYAKQGYEFYRCDEIPFQISPGCLASAFGSKVTYGYVTIVSFRKKINIPAPS